MGSRRTANIVGPYRHGSGVPKMGGHRVTWKGDSPGNHVTLLVFGPGPTDSGATAAEVVDALRKLESYDRLAAGLAEIAGLEIGEPEEPEEWGGYTQKAESWGIRVGRFRAAQMARDLLRQEAVFVVSGQSPQGVAPVKDHHEAILGFLRRIEAILESMSAGRTRL